MFVFVLTLIVAACAITAEMHMWTWLYDEKESFESEFANWVANPIKFGVGWVNDKFHLACWHVRQLLGWLAFVLFVIWYVYRATWLTEVWAIWSITSRWLTMWRLAP